LIAVFISLVLNTLSSRAGTQRQDFLHDFFTTFVNTR
jgi:hypothetical protein